MNRFKPIFAMFFFSVIFFGSQSIFAMVRTELGSFKHTKIYMDELRKFKKKVTSVVEIDADKILDYLNNPKKEIDLQIKLLEVRCVKLSLELRISERVSDRTEFTLIDVKAIVDLYKKLLENLLNLYEGEFFCDVYNYKLPSNYTRFQEDVVCGYIYDYSFYKLLKKRKKIFFQF